MYRSPIRGKIRPKLSSIPRGNSPASIYLSIYKMTLEKERLQQELHNIETRRDRIKDRIALLDKQTETELKRVKKNTEGTAKSLPKKEEFKNFQTMTLEY